MSNLTNSDSQQQKQLLRQWMIIITCSLPFSFYMINQYFHDIVLLNLHYEEVHSNNHIILSLLISIYRSLFIINLILFLTFINIKVWEKFQISYKSIFKLNEDYYDSLELVLKKLCFIVSTIFIVLILISQSLLNSSDIYRGNLSFKLSITTWIWLLSGSILLYNKSIRRIIGISLIDIIKTPIQSVSFISFWVADQMTSLPLFIKDLNFIICYISSLFSGGSMNLTICYNQTNLLAPLIFSSPLIIRMIQCFRVYYDTNSYSQLFNLLKYFISFLLVLIPHHKAIWLPLALISTFYSYYWDIIKDWGLGNRDSSNKFLRDVLIYNDKNFYYFSIITNFIMRFGWLVPIILERFENEFNHDILYIYLIIMEVIRRNQWNFIRLEYEVILRNKVSF